MGELLDMWIDIKAGFVLFFKGEEEKRRYLYREKYKPRIKKGLENAVSTIYYEYYNAIKREVDRLQMYCEETRDDSFEEELGRTECVSAAKEKLHGLLEKETDFYYEEKDLMQLLFGNGENV